MSYTKDTYTQVLEIIKTLKNKKQGVLCAGSNNPIINRTILALVCFQACITSSKPYVPVRPEKYAPCKYGPTCSTVLAFSLLKNIEAIPPLKNISGCCFFHSAEDARSSFGEISAIFKEGTIRNDFISAYANVREFVDAHREAIFAETQDQMVLFLRENPEDKAVTEKHFIPFIKSSMLFSESSSAESSTRSRTKAEKSGGRKNSDDDDFEPVSPKGERLNFGKPHPPKKNYVKAAGQEPTESELALKELEKKIAAIEKDAALIERERKAQELLKIRQAKFEELKKKYGLTDSAPAAVSEPAVIEAKK